MEEKTQFRRAEDPVDIETRRNKQRALMARMVERKVRSRAKQLYEARGQEEGQALQDWFQAETEMLENKLLANLYRRVKTGIGTTGSSESDVKSLGSPAYES